MQIIGDFNLGRARGVKAQQRRAGDQHQPSKNTIDFRPSNKTSSKQVQLLPQTRGQEQLVLDLLDETNHIVITVGPAGTGKSYLATLAALRDLKIGKVNKIVITRPAIEVDQERHGFLPGDLTSKMEPWVRPLIDVMKEYIEYQNILHMIEQNVIEIAPLAFMRGRTFKNAWIIADEMQNSTVGQMKMLMTRIGQGSRIVVTGDIEQTDRPGDSNGLIDVVKRLQQKNVPGIKMCALQTRDIRRHPIIDQVLTVYQ